MKTVTQQAHDENVTLRTSSPEINRLIEEVGREEAVRFLKLGDIIFNNKTRIRM